MQANTAPATKNATQYAPAYEWQPTIPPSTMMMPTSNCPPPAENQAQFVDAQDSTGYICEVAQNVAIVEKQSPTGTVFIPIQRHLSELCTKFHCRQENDNEYTLGDIYLALKSETGYARAESCTSPLFIRLQVQLMDNNFACSEQGRFAQLLLYLHRPIKVRRQGAHFVPLNGMDQLEEARFDRLLPYQQMGRTHPGYYWMHISLPAFGGHVLIEMGSPEQLLFLFKPDR